VQFLTRTVSGQFVNWTKVLPYNARYKLQIDPASTVDVLKDLGRIAANDNNRVVFRWDEKWYLASAANDGEYIGVKQDDGTVVRYWTGEQKRERTIRPIRVDGDYLDSPADFALNFRYACDYLDWQKGDVELWINGGLNPLMFVNGSTKYVLMPMQIF
jgi:DNA polymerase III sliding clamp (beta) subunit (PCNA family)